MNFKTDSFEIIVSPEFVAAVNQLIGALHLAGLICALLIFVRCVRLFCKMLNKIETAFF
ncbi:hypothetical protein [Bacillus cereus]|uniref:hypothetical protein n=1 Tax=Bacillus cereus TaxID=1396 RepID=UPI0015E10A1E|nr:hypothetical protein [Bacillus cereus]